MKVKVIIQLVIVLIIGFFIGFLTNSSIVSKKIKNYNWRSGEVRFWSHTLDEIHASEDQRDEIMPIVFKYSEKGHEIMRDAMQDIEPLWEEMEKEIAPVLTRDQLKIVEDIKKRRVEKFRERTKRWKNGNKDSDKWKGRGNRNSDEKPLPPPPPRENQ